MYRHVYVYIYIYICVILLYVCVCVRMHMYIYINTSIRSVYIYIYIHAYHTYIHDAGLPYARVYVIVSLDMKLNHASMYPYCTPNLVESAGG